MSEFDYLFKIVVVGDGGVGKTALTVRFAEGVFRDDYKMTIGVDFSIKTIKVPINGETRNVKLQIWDTGGQERFSYVRPLYYKGAVGGLIVFDLTSRKSYENLSRWFTEVSNNCVSIPVILVGNKSDLPDREVAHSEIEKIAANQKLPYFESSAKSGLSVNTIFEKLSSTLVMIEEGQVVQEEIDPEAQKHKQYIEKYMALAEQAYGYINKANYEEALKLLKEAYYYAKEIEYQEGKKWIEEQTQLIIQMLRQQESKATQEAAVYMYCAYCNQRYRVSRVGNIRCPKCGNYLSGER
ncbi:MAG: GTP-binding protein [Candidatus Helarchaeota archaeon]|nr:GTP-binding protein [Candidatus Helarchaeota archaeon]